MKIVAWRIFKPRHEAVAFTGEGAKLFGGRWNRRGTSVVYTSGSQALAALEMLVHLASAQVLREYRVCSVQFDSSVVENLDPVLLPEDWRDDPAPRSLADIGERWVREARSVALRVPSAVLSSEFNYLLNPAHRGYSRVVIGKPENFEFDARLAK